MSEVAEVLDISHSSACATLHYNIGYRKKCAKWVPRQLTDPRKQQCVQVTTQFLQCYEENSGLLYGMVTGMRCGCTIGIQKARDKEWSGNIRVSHESRSSEVSPQWKKNAKLLGYAKANFGT